MAYNDSAPLAQLIEKLCTLPSTGKKTAERLAFHIISQGEEYAKEFSDAIMNAATSIHRCPICQNLIDGTDCPVCTDLRRDHSMICVVSDPRDVRAFERKHTFNGDYHVLHGLISPMNGIGPNELALKELLARLNNKDVKEVIMATNATVEGEATAMYISQLIKPLGIKVTRLAYGIPVGASLEFADDITLGRALDGRNEM